MVRRRVLWYNSRAPCGPRRVSLRPHTWVHTAFVRSGVARGDWLRENNVGAVPKKRVTNARQGNQAAGMGADIYASSPAARAVFEAVDRTLDMPLSRLCFEGPDETLRETISAQPAIVTVSLALLAALREAMGAPPPALDGAP